MFRGESDPFLEHTAAAPAIAFLMDRLIEVKSMPTTWEAMIDQEILLRAQLEASGILDTVPERQRRLISLLAYARAEEWVDDLSEVRSL
jgi:hypothetical protein